MKYIVLVIATILNPVFSFSQKHWESIIVNNNTWRYLPATSEPATNWHTIAFNDNAWLSGPGGFGYADGDDGTVIEAVNSVYMRKKFSVANPSVITQLVLDVDYDDAYVAYMNGNEVARSYNITDNPPLYNSQLTVDHEASLYQGQMPERNILDPSVLVEGDNVLAVQILNIGTASSDMSGNVFLSAEVNSSSSIYQPLPSWFYVPVAAGESNLPLILINTSGQDIVDDPRIVANMKVINSPGGTNSITDNNFEYNGNIEIEIRGSSSQGFEKKNYSLETIYNADSNINVSLLGMPKENDWVLHGPYSDKSLMRNALAYYLGNLTGQWAPRTRFCELYINNDYRGVYLLIEKIKIDKNRVNIATLNPDEISGDDLTGGYIMKIDRPDPGAWASPYKGLNGHDDIYFSYVKPEYPDMPAQQRNYIKNYVTDFEDALYGATFKDPAIGYRAFINVQSFVDHYIVNELSRNVDGYRLSAFFYKDKDSKGGKITMGPLWDFNLGFGNADYYDGANANGWVADGVGSYDNFQIPFWWQRLREDPFFDAQLKIRWTQLRAKEYSNENIEGFIDSCAALLSSAQQRNFQRFQVLGSYVWPNAYIGNTYSNEINYLKDWIADRFYWMDYEIGLLNSIDEPMADIGAEISVNVFPNPFTESVSFVFNLADNSGCTLIIRNILGQQVFATSFSAQQGVNEIMLDNPLYNESPGIYIYELQSGNSQAITGKLVKE
ncbi:MAG: CotH kinase family protein [Bacteroidales bacterium]|nr:CotH kinase family protein [Bacteroidales bacterium]